MTEEKQPLRIVSLEAENVMRLKAVHIEPTSNVVILEGRNRQGKTSIMTTISAVLGGEKLCPKRPIRDGEKEAQGRINLGEFTVERKWTGPGKSHLKVTHNDGDYPIGSPQAFLNRLLGQLAFDPMEFCRMDAKGRREMLRKVAGIDTTELDARRKTAYEKRRDNNRDLDRVKKELIGLKDVPEAVKTVRPIEEVQAEYDERKAWNDAIPTDRQIADAADEYDEARSALAEAEEKLNALRIAAKQKPKDMTKISAELDAAREAGGAAFKIEQKRKKTRERNRLAKLSKEQDDLIAEIDAEKQRMLEDTSMPIPGIVVGEEDVEYNGVPFSQASGAEQTRVAMAIGMAENPRLRVILINDGSLCDAETMKEIEKIATDNGYQVWIERVADGPRKTRGSVYYIEDGEVR